MKFIRAWDIRLIRSANSVEFLLFPPFFSFFSSPFFVFPFTHSQFALQLLQAKHGLYSDPDETRVGAPHEV